jgi:peptidoglycan/LPS O-acetylase OafA/YrhL
MQGRSGWLRAWAPVGAGYRPDIDGLRAIAVLAVLFSHLETRRLQGGYVGVDVFFVISGYLIGGQVLAGFADGGFSLAAFYERRVRRIVPALVAMLAAVFVVSWLVDFPVPTARVGASGLAALASVSNVYYWANAGDFFWTLAGYFAPVAGDMPLLHTWSLGVEEQFYVAFPLLIWAARAWLGPCRVLAALGVVCALSFGLAAAGVWLNTIATFYLLPTRAWELLVGALLSQQLVPAPATPGSRNLWALAGAVLIAVPALLYGKETPFPGLAAVPPCLGALLIIAAGERGGSVVGRVLASPPLVFVGLISYSLYLWHWPLIVYEHRLTILYGDAVPWKWRVAIIGASFVIATLSWLLVERPFRDRRRIAAPVIWGGAAASFVVLGIGAAAAMATDGFPDRFSPHVRALAAYMEEGERGPTRAAYRVGTCFLEAFDSFSKFDQTRCLTPRPGQASVLVIGDSHAADLRPGLEAALPGVSVLQATHAGCRPTLTLAPDAVRSCTDMMQFVYGQLLTSRPFLRVVVSGDWKMGDVPRVVASANWAKAHGLPMLIVGPAPAYVQPLPALLARAAMRPDGAQMVTRAFDVGRARVDAVLKQALAATGIPYVSLLDSLCHGRDCVTLAAPDVPLELDTGHLTIGGSNLVGAILRPSILGAPAGAKPVS